MYEVVGFYSIYSRLFRARVGEKNCSIKENNKWRRFQQVVDVQHIHNTDGPANNNNETRTTIADHHHITSRPRHCSYNVLIILKKTFNTRIIYGSSFYRKLGFF